MLLGHSGVGKSTLVNRLVPEADRAIGEVSGVGKGRHTSSQSVALPLAAPAGSIDTPGIRSFGLAHIEPDDVMLAFSDLAEAIKDCPRGCGHLGPPADPECALDTLTGPAAGRVGRGAASLEALKTIWPDLRSARANAKRPSPVWGGPLRPVIGWLRALMCQMPWWLCQPGVASAAGLAFTLGA